MTLPNTDLFIINRNRTNYQVDYNNLKQYIPGMPAGARCLFYMDSSPYGWSIDKDAKFTEATVRVVSGSGGSNGGNKDFSYVFKSWDTSVPTHSHGVGGGNHNHTGAVSHNHTLSDPGHTHIVSRMGSLVNYRSDMVDLAEPLYIYGSTDGEKDVKQYKIAVSDPEVSDEFVEGALELLNGNEYIQTEAIPSLLFETTYFNSTEGFVSILQALSDFSDGVISQEELNVIVDTESQRIESLKVEIFGDRSSRVTPGGSSCPYYIAICECYCERSEDDSTSNDTEKHYKTEELGGYNTSELEFLGSHWASACDQSRCDSLASGGGSGKDWDYCKCDGDCEVECYDLKIEKPEPAYTNLSINAASPAVSFGSKGTSGLGTTNTTGNVGNNIDFKVKYHKGIVCQKDPY